VTAAASPPYPRAWSIVAASAAVAIVVVAGVWAISASVGPAPPTVRPFATFPLPPVWTTTVPNDTAFGGVLEDGAYVTIVPISSLPSLGNLQFRVDAFALDDGTVLWQSVPLSIENAGNVQPTLAAGPNRVFLVGYASSLVSPGEPWNGTDGVFWIGFDAASGAVASFGNESAPPSLALGEVTVSGGTIYAGYLVNAGAVLEAIPLPGVGAASGVWSTTLDLPADFSSNLVFSVADGFGMVLLPSSLAVFNASSGRFLEQIPFESPLNLFDGTVLGGVAYGVDWTAQSVDLVGYNLSTGSLIVNRSLGGLAVVSQPSEVRHISDVLLVSTSGGAQWSAYTPAGTLLWSSPTLPTNFGPGPVPVLPNGVLFYGGGPGGVSQPATGNVSFPAEFVLENLTTGATLWEESSWFQIPADASLFLAADLQEQPPGPCIEASGSGEVVFWWAGTTGLAVL
jgi:hypothetical protein